MGELVVNPELCVDCGLCERNCPNNAIRVHDNVPLFCMHCSPDKAPCLAVCPKGAIQALGGAINIDELGQANKCDLCEEYDCQQCVEACPTGALTNDQSEIIRAKQDKLADGYKKIQSLLK